MTAGITSLSVFAGPIDTNALRNPVWTSEDILRDPSVLKVEDGYLIFHSRLAGHWGSASSWTMKPFKANLLGHAVTRDPNLEEWEILTPNAPLLSRSARAPDGVENVMVYSTGDHWTMLFSEGLRKQHLAWATSADLRSWKVGGEVEVQRQEWMAVK